jgi:cytochrome b561
MLFNTSTHYGSIAKFLHWLMAVLFIALFTVAYQMMDMQPGEQKWSLYGLHKATGVVMFALAILRLTWRITQPQPSLPLDMPLWQQRIAKGTMSYFIL